MSFNSFQFWVVFPLLFSIYWMIPSRRHAIRKWFLIVVSYLLYMNWRPAFALVLFGVTCVTYLGALSFGRHGRKRCLVWSVALLALLPLIVFKYYNFLNATLTDGLRLAGLEFSLPGLNWAIPVGISFFTFQAVGYLFDVYYRRVEAERSFTDYVLFVAFFPQVSSGPISKASELLPQLKTLPPFSYRLGVSGLKWLLWGMFLKLAVADRLGLYVDAVYAHYHQYSGLCCLVASVFYTLQIYADFAGYSLMAMGIAATLGIRLVNNFRRPYFSLSVTDFWRRWHISLSRWLKDYVYIPLGGSRCSKWRNYLNIFVTFLVSGVWHGASWTFVIWGAFHGLCQIVEKALGLQKGEDSRTAVRLFRILVTFTVVNVAWIFFRMPTLSGAVAILGHIFTHFGTGAFLTYELTSLEIVLPILILKDLRDEFFSTRLPLHKWVRRACYVLIFCLIIFLGVLDSSQFIYVSF